MIIASSQGGVNIEEVAATNPTAIMYEPIDIQKGITPEQASRIISKLGLDNVKDYISNIITSLYAMFLKKDALLLEVNPLAEDINGNCKNLIFSKHSSFQSLKNNLSTFYCAQTLRLTANADLTTTQSSGKRISSRCETGVKKTQRKWKLPSSTSTTLHLTEISVAWLTEPVLPWQRWTSLNYTAESLPISSTSAVARLHPL